MSVRGVYLVVQPIPQVGHKLGVSFFLPGDPIRIAAEARVAWRNPPSALNGGGGAAPHLPAGCGIQFLDLDAADYDRIEARVVGAKDRRSRRVSLRVSLRVENEYASCNAHTAVVNRHGALILCPVQYAEGAELEVWNLESDERGRFRVAWYGGQDLPGLHKTGIEMLAYRPAFWGPEYDELAGL